MFRAEWFPGVTDIFLPSWENAAFFEYRAAQLSVNERMETIKRTATPISVPTSVASQDKSIQAGVCNVGQVYP